MNFLRLLSYGFRALVQRLRLRFVGRILFYINGLPLVFIELKNSSVKLKTAYDDNLTNYKADIPQLFLPNALCVLSNGLETRGRKSNG